MKVSGGEGAKAVRSPRLEKRETAKSLVSSDPVTSLGSTWPRESS